MAIEMLNYADLAARLKISPEAAGRLLSGSGCPDRGE
jgi:hypothetical protein